MKFVNQKLHYVRRYRTQEIFIEVQYAAISADLKINKTNNWDQLLKANCLSYWLTIKNKYLYSFLYSTEFI